MLRETIFLSKLLPTRPNARGVEERMRKIELGMHSEMRWRLEMCVMNELISLLCLHMTYFLPPACRDSCICLFATLISLARFHSLTQHHAIPARYEGEIMEAGVGSSKNSSMFIGFAFKANKLNTSSSMLLLLLLPLVLLRDTRVG